MDLAAMRAERDRLDQEIRRAEEKARSDWNEGMTLLADALDKAGLVSHWKTRKNERIGFLRGGDFETGPAEVRIGFIMESYGAWLRVQASDGFALEWDVARGVPETEKFLALVRRMAES